MSGPTTRRRVLIRAARRPAHVPSEIASKEQFKKLLAQAFEVRVVRAEDSAKVKLRTKKGLFTFKATKAEADALTKGTKVPVVEI